jgi:hypothetical protein
MRMKFRSNADVGFVLFRSDMLLARFLLFGLLVGFAELPAVWLVDYTRARDYSIGGGPMIWRSPLWMPLLGSRGGAINIPFHEEMARRIGGSTAVVE